MRKARPKSAACHAAEMQETEVLPPGAGWRWDWLGRQNNLGALTYITYITYIYFVIFDSLMYEYITINIYIHTIHYFK
jgi:hypothetical protein